MASKRLSEFKGFTPESVVKFVVACAGERVTTSLKVVAKRIAEIPEFSCSIPVGDSVEVKDFLEKWTEKFIKGFENRASKRTSNPIGTKHDPLLDDIISARLPNHTEDLDAIRYGHRLAMSAENIAGSLLEEYLAQELGKHGWHCCWGETMKSIDFCHENGALLQIKNSDNSENSSSKTVRDGTEIKHWFRRFSRNGETNWKALNELVGIENVKEQLTEDSFRTFAKKVIKENPGSLFLEEESPWYGI